MQTKAAAAPPNRCLSFVFWFALFFSAPIAFAAELAGPLQTLQVGTARLIAGDDFIAPGEERDLFLRLDLPAGWHTYWKNPGDTGLATEWKADLPPGAYAGAIRWPLPQKILSEGFVNYGYSGTVILPASLRLDADFSGRRVPVKAKVDWLVCKDICLPETADLTLEWRVRQGTHAALPDDLQAVVAQVPAPLPMRYNFDGQSLWAVISAPNPAPGGDVFLETVNAAKLDAAPVTVTAGKDVGMIFSRGLSPGKDGFAFAGRSQGRAYSWRGNYDSGLLQPHPAPPQKNILLTIALAFLGGLLLNVLPCVLPVLSLKILSLLQKSEVNRRQALFESLYYTLGIELGFAAIAGLLLLLRHGGAALGWGFQMQQPAFVLAMALLTFAVGLMLSGLFTLPMLFGNLHHRIGRRDHPLASFATGLLAMLVATPCTAPFMASAIGYALTREPAEAMLIFLSLGAGMASPFLLIGLFPPLQRLLPKPGRWMETLKEALAFPMYATAAWLLWVLAGEAGPIGLGTGLLLIVSAAFVLWWIKRLHRRAPKVALLILLLLGIGDALVDLSRLAADTTPQAEVFSQEKLDRLHRAGTPVLVDVTADWCLTCKLNERIALRDPAVQAHFAETHLLLLTADWTRRDPVLAEYLAGFGRSGVPAYIYYPPQGAPRLLPQLLSPAGVIAATEDSGR